MSHACVFRPTRFALPVFVLVLVGGEARLMAQGTTWSASLHRMLPKLSGSDSNDRNMMETAELPPPPTAPRRGPLAQLIANPDQSDGTPPFALADQSGVIQRYVEPVPGIDLAAHVGQVVVVRHDTGPTLLASQLDLPPRPLYPMVREGGRGDYAGPTGLRPIDVARNDPAVMQAQYVDNDDSTVQLLPDGPAFSSGYSSGPMMMQGQPMGPGGEYPPCPNDMGQMTMGGPTMGSPGYMPMMQPQGGYYSNQMMGMQPCPQCGRSHPMMMQGQMPMQGPVSYGPTSYGPDNCCDNCCEPCADCCEPRCCKPKPSRFTADVELMLLRPQLSEDAFGKLSEEYQFSPRFVLGVRDIGNLDFRGRYWHYDQESKLLGDEDIQFDFDVFDIEALHRFCWNRSHLILAGGVRLAAINLSDAQDEKSGGDFIGLTMAADGRTTLVSYCKGHLGWVYGGRISILAGDWGGEDNSDFVDHQARNDNILVHELYAGGEITHCFGAFNCHARLVFEMQNWKSDVLAQDADVDSIGFLGPGLQLGADF
jgi:hypothetical protein